MQTISFTTQAIPKPAGLVLGGWRIRMMRNSDNAVVLDHTGGPSVEPGLIANGSYTLSASRLDSEGNDVAPPATRQFTVTDGETMDVPLQILVGGA
jgi:hypothetical protein